MSLVEEALRRLQAQAKSRPIEPRSSVAAAGPVATGVAAEKTPYFRFAVTTGRAAKFAAPKDDGAWLAWSMQKAPVLSSQLRALRREINDSLRELDSVDQAKVVLISSALPNDGKSFVSLAMARTFGVDSRSTVTLIDGDLPKRHLTRMFGLDAAPGLADCLAGKVEIADVVYATDVEGVSIIPAGTWSLDAADHFASSRLDHFLATIRSCGPDHLFVMDSTPVLAAGEAVYGAARADLVIVVARANETPRGAIEEAVRKLSAAPRLGLLLNGHTTGSIAHYYGYTDSYDQASHQ